MFVKVPLLPRVRHGSFICELNLKISWSVFIIECFWTVVYCCFIWDYFSTKI